MRLSRPIRKNMSRLDRGLRAGLGACLVCAAFLAPWLIDIPAVNLAMGAFGLLNVAAASAGVCPGYLLFGVSTRRSHRGPRAAGGGPEAVPVDGLSAALRNRLVLCIVLPGILAASAFGVVLHRFASERVTDDMTVEGRAVALLAAHLAGAALRDGTPAPAVPGIAPLEAATAGLVFHDREGDAVRHPLQRPPDASVPMDELMRAVAADLAERSPRDRGRLRTPTSHLLWVTERVPGERLWVTSVVDARGYDAALALLFGPRFLVLVLTVLWLTMWGAIYNVRKYTQRMSAGALEIRRRSRHDPLTGLLNRAGLDELLHRRLAASGPDGRTALVVVDLIDFRAINDSLGYTLADDLLREVADRIRTVVPGGCEVARTGADTFAIVCTGLDDTGRTRLIVRRLHQIVDSTYPVGEARLTLASRSGIAFAPPDAADAAELVRSADLALSRAKRTGSRHCRYAPEEHAWSVRRLTLMSALRGAIAGGELRLVYQPKIALDDGRLSGVEALVRWDHPEYGPIPPDEFVSLAERAGLIDVLTHWVLLDAERQSLAWRAEGLKVPVAVNLSPLNLRNPTLPDLVERLVSSGGFAGGLLELELTENAVMVDADLAMERLHALRELGTTLSIDDFGTGQSSFAYLQRFPIGNLKIDRRFVMALTSGAEEDGDVLLLRSMIELGHGMGLVVTAEGVEDRSSLERLRALGCDYAQGYHIARPMEPGALPGWLRERGELPAAGGVAHAEAAAAA